MTLVTQEPSLAAVLLTPTPTTTFAKRHGVSKLAHHPPPPPSFTTTTPSILRSRSKIMILPTTTTTTTTISPRHKNGCVNPAVQVGIFPPWPRRVTIVVGRDIVLLHLLLLLRVHVHYCCWIILRSSRECPRSRQHVEEEQHQQEEQCIALAVVEEVHHTHQ